MINIRLTSTSTEDINSGEGDTGINREELIK